MTGEESTLMEALLDPISSEHPCGVDVTYDDDFQQLKSAVDGLSAAHGPEVDFGLLVELGQRVLTQRSKDLRAAVFLTFGLERTRGAEGLAQGLGIVDGIVRTYWDDLFPPKKRMAGRQNALQSLSDRLKVWIADDRFHGPDRPHLESARERLTALQQYTLTAMGESAPALSGLGQAIDEAIRRMPSEATASNNGGNGMAATTAPTTTPVPAPAPRTSLAASPQPDVLEKPADAIAAVQRAADFLLRLDRTNPLPYLLLRDLRWTPLAAEPPNENGRTLIPPPTSQARESLERVAAGGNALALAEVAEDVFHASPLLLDAQRHLVQALQGMKEDTAAARDAIVFSLAGLLGRIPSLPKLSYSDGTPFADGATRAWMDSVVTSLAGATQPKNAPAAQAEDGLDEVHARANAMLGKGDVRGALAAMLQGSDGDPSGSARFRRRFLAARLCMTARQYALARPLLEGLDEDVQRHELAQWEPSIAREVWTLLYQCLESLGNDGDVARSAVLAEKSRHVFDRICRLDPTHAMTLLRKP